MAARKTANLAVKPAVSGMPASASRNSVITAAVSGEREASPAHCERWLASPSPSRTSGREGPPLPVPARGEGGEGEGAECVDPVVEKVKHGGRRPGAVARPEPDHTG